MNFLAHCLLAGPGDGFLAGAVLGDFVKGRIPARLPAELRAGIRLHRRIDSCANALPAMKPSLRRFPGDLRRVAPVLLDIVADHCLALAWSRFSPDRLGGFAATVYAAIDRYRDLAPPAGQRFVAHMAKTDLLVRYDDPAVVRQAMAHVLRRLRRGHLEPKLAQVLGPALPGLQADFLGYFPQLQAFARAERPKAMAFARAGAA